MKFIKFLLVLFISINSPIKADLNLNLINELKKGGNLIFIRHAYAPGGGDPNNFNINDCKTQRNLSNTELQATREFFQAAFMYTNVHSNIPRVWVAGLLVFLLEPTTEDR